ncbi:hypothetical protein ACIOWF_06675 [Cellulosimicrobium cellulans]|uniref:hypothetical protein n=1 Tax=Cellulosimicrobium cellulans TaxID=1710 RepID=UPI0038295586
MTTSTQQAHPVRASWRTAAQAVVSVVLVLGLVAPLVAAILSDELDGYLPDRWLAWVVGAAAVLAAVSAALARIMAIPAVDAWLRHLGLSSTPTVAPDNDGVHNITTMPELAVGDAVEIRASGLVGTVQDVYTPTYGSSVQYSVLTVEGTFVYGASDLERVESPPA